jgi:hypothetical protein
LWTHGMLYTHIVIKYFLTWSFDSR